MRITLSSVLCVMVVCSCVSAKMLHGTDTPCEGEGEKVLIPGITDLPCIHCVCREGFVQCQRHECANLDGCHAILFDKPKNSCCDVCKGCTVNGTDYPSGATWTDPDSPCVMYHCQAGVLTQSTEKCYVECEHPLHLPGQCCASCSDCSFQGVGRAEGETFQHASKPDVTCVCKAGRVHCSYRPCPVLNCPQAAYHTQPGHHCPKCRDQRKVFTVPNSCFFARRVFAQGTILRPDPCTTCTCNAGTVYCEREACPAVPCDVRDHVYENGTCCPKCPDLRGCLYGNQSYATGSHWLRSDTCQQCQCQNGVIYCRRQTCPDTPVCPKGHSLKYPVGACCPQCIKDDAICSMTVNSHHVTFDARAFHAHGTCRYHVSRDCKHRSFNVKIRNSPRAGEAFWTELVTVRLRNSTINLYRSLQARVNRRPVGLPYVADPRFVLQQIGQRLIVDAYDKMGVKVVWDGGNHLEVTVSKRHRGNLCGLCGNNNGDPTDDFRDKQGAIVDDANDFLRAWRVRGMCHTAKSPVTSADLITACRPGSSGAVRAEGYCGGFFHREFNACASRIDVMPYISWCLHDACLCPKTSSCHLRSIRSLARRCKRAGFHVRWWRVAR